MIQDFITDARRYCEARGINLTTLGLYAVSDSRLFSRLEAGGQCLPRTIDRVRRYMSENPPTDKSADQSPTPTREEDAA